MTSERTQSNSSRTDVLILGAGFSGLAAAATISRAGGLDYLILEQGDDVGGTWRENTYPGCACDIPSPLYSFSFRQNPDWRHLFAPQQEILDYLRDTSAELRITERVRFGTTVTGADWDEQDSTWTVEAADGSVFRARFLVSAMGLLHHASYPKLAGLENFQGEVFHSAHWNHSCDLEGKKVAVVGTGASAIQFVPAIVDQTAKLTLFQRTAPWIAPKFNRAFSEEEREEMRRNPIKRWNRRARLFWIHEKRAKGFVSDTSKMGPTKALASGHLKKQISDPALRAKLTPGYEIGCKRLLISSDYYPALVKPHVDVVTAGVGEVRAKSVIDTDGNEYDADVIIFGTGFDAQNSLSRVPIRGRDGVALGSQWASGPEAYLGTTVAGFPNLFLLCGPNTGLGHNSQVFMIEAQARYMKRCIRYAGRRGVIEVRQDAQDRFNQFLQGRLSSTVWQAGGCKSWYQDPVTGRNTLLWPKSTLSYWLRTRFLRRTDYRRSMSTTTTQQSVTVG